MNQKILFCRKIFVFKLLQIAISHVVFERIYSGLHDFALEYGQVLIEYTREFNVLAIAETLERAQNRRGISQMPSIARLFVYDDYNRQLSGFCERDYFVFGVRVYFCHFIAKSEVVQVGGDLRTVGA